MRSNFAKAVSDAQRLSGQATTALGNVITNMQVHADFVQNNYSAIVLVLMLGDDNLMLFNRYPDTSNLKQHIKYKYNMMSKHATYDNHGTFCQLVVYKNNQGGVGIGPDYIRLRNRF